MGLLDTYRINKAITVLLASYEEAGPDPAQAIATLKRLGTSAIPRLIEALGKTARPQALIALLSSMVTNTTLPLFSDGLSSANPRIVASVAEVLSQTTAYDPNRLLDWCTEPRISKATLGKLLAARKELLQPERILQALDAVRADDRPLLLGLVRQVVNADTVSVLLPYTAHADHTVRLAMVRMLARFRTPEVQAAFMMMFTDTHGAVREAVLEGLAGFPGALDVIPICQLLKDPEKSVRRQASVLLTQRKDPATLPYLFDVLQDPLPEVQQSAVELLALIGDTGSMKAVVASHADATAMRDVLMRLLEMPQTRVRQLALDGLMGLQIPLDMGALCRLLWDTDRTIRQQAIQLLTQLSTPETLPLLLEILQDDNTEVRQGAVTILNAIADASLLQELLYALRDQEWWVTMRVTDALGRSGEAKVIDAALRLLLSEDAELRRAALEIVKVVQDPQVVNFLSDVLEQADVQIQIYAVEAAGAINEKRTVPALLRLAQTDNLELRLVVLHALTTLGDARAIPLLLTYLREGPASLQAETLPALATVTDSEHAEEVLQAVMAIRSTDSADLKTLANNTASALIRRFGIRAVGRSSASMEISASRPAQASLLYEAAAHSPAQVTMATPAPSDGQATSLLAESPIAEPILDATTLEPGRLLAGRYRVVRHIGQGGFGTVVLAEDTMVHEQLILKFLNPQMAADARMIKRFIRELRYARRVTHENVIRIHDFLHIENVYAISMEYFPSHSLSAELPRNTPMPLQRGLRILWHICRGMHAAHQVKIIHRDLKPPNVLIGETGVVKIVDFGLAAAVSDTVSRLTRTGALLGTPLYMAPEQVQNCQIDARTDIYSLGVMMYEIFTGRPPYSGANPMAILYQHLEGKAVPPREVCAEISPELEGIIQKAMAVEPAQRFQSMDTLGKSLIPLLKQTT